MSNIRNISTSITVGNSKTESIALNQYILSGLAISGSNCTASYVGFEVSPDGITYYPLIGNDNTEVLIPVTSASQAFALDVFDFIPWSHVKVREGVSASPVLQKTYDQPITLIIRSA